MVVCSRCVLFQTGITSTPRSAASMQARSCACAWWAKRSPTPKEYFPRDSMATPLVADSYHRLDDTGFRTRVRRKNVDQLLEGGTVGNPGPGIDAALLDELNDARKVRGQGVARA